MSTKTLTQEELKNVIAYADSLQQYDRRRQDQHLLEGIVKRETENERLSLPMVYEIGQELDIPQEYMERAVELLYPSKEQMVKSIERFNATKAGLDWRWLYNGYAQALLETLQTKLSPEQLRMLKFRDGLWEQMQSGEPLIIPPAKKKLRFQRKIGRGKLLWKSVRWKTIADLHLKSHHLDYATWLVDAYEPLFLQVVGKELEKLSTQFSPIHISYHVTYHYNIPKE